MNPHVRNLAESGVRHRFQKETSVAPLEPQSWWGGPDFSYLLDLVVIAITLLRRLVPRASAIHESGHSAGFVALWQ